MEAHRGFIRCPQRPGMGSVFELHFPPATVPEEPAA
jgi:signal transduction histidine kinase